MNIDRILGVLNAGQVEYLLIGGVNFLLRHGPDLTYDVDVWIHDTEGSRRRCEVALATLGAEWSRDEEDWGPVARRPAGWISEQSLYCMTGLPPQQRKTERIRVLRDALKGKTSP